MQKLGLVLALTFFIFSQQGAAEVSEVMISEICGSIIPFAQNNGAEVSERDFYHCHVLVGLKEGEPRKYSNYRDWNFFEQRREAYICHAHEKDLLRENDNFNILYLNGVVSFWGANYPVTEEDILTRYGYPKEKYLLSWTNIYFFPSDSRFCPLLAKSTNRTCGGKPMCIGLESDEYDRANTQPQPVDPEKKPWEQ